MFLNVFGSFDVFMHVLKMFYKSVKNMFLFLFAS